MTAKAPTALVAGATGLVGGECLARIVATPTYASVLVLTRRALPPELVRDPRVRQLVCDFARLDDVARELAADHVFCTLGTTIRKAGSQSAFREVDFEYPRRLAQVALRQGATHFSVVSALGADRR